MKFRIINLMLMAISVTIAFTSCDIEAEALEIQKLNVYDDQYYANLRAWKATAKERQVSFVWYEAYSPIEGVAGYKDPASWGERIKGLPDSLDICSLWMGIPSNDPTSDDYAPIAYEDMRYAQKVLGTRFVATTITRMNNKTITLKDGTEYSLHDNRNNDGIKVYAQYLVDQVLDAGLDGIDLDYEPEGDYLTGAPFTVLVQEVAKYFGPKGMYPDKLFTIDFYSAYPPSATEEYVDYFIRQAYTQGFTEHNATRLQTYYNSISWTAPEKFIVTENFGEFFANGGTPFTEADGNTLSADGSRMMSLEGMARWHPTQGRKGGFGVFYLGRSYHGIAGPYTDFRRAIQIANPAIK